MASSKALEMTTARARILSARTVVRSGRKSSRIASRIKAERGITMKRFIHFLVTATLALLFVSSASADTLELKDGRVLQGRYLGGTQAVLRFEVDGNVQTFGVNEVVAVTFTHSGRAVAAPPPAPTLAPPPAPVAQAQPISAGGSITIPAGQSI